MVLVKGMVAAMRSVGSTLVLLLACMYVFGIVFTQWCKGMPDERRYGDSEFDMFFCSVGKSMFTLFQIMVVDDTMGLVRLIMADTYVMVYVTLFYILLTSFTVQ